MAGKQSEQGCPGFPFPGHFLHFYQGDLKAFPGQPRNIVSPRCGPFSKTDPSGTYLELKGHLKQMPKLPQLVKSGGAAVLLRAPDPISKSALPGN